jgi:TolB-like protein/DNA-binding winged helix-turn-helix (wHTH) protein/Flp pilus assembly protein TadD
MRLTRCGGVGVSEPSNSPFSLDLGRYELRRNREALRLERIPMELLILLVEHWGALVTREQIVERLWGKDVFVDTEQGINTAIRKVRSALRDDPENPTYVQTVVGKGYRFVGPIEVVRPASTAQHAAEDHSGSAVPGFLQLQRWNQAAIVCVLLAPTLALLAIAVRGRPSIAPGAKPIRCLAVLPLENLSGNPAEDYFADGMTEALVTNLGKVKDLRVISRTSVARYKGTKRPVQEIAKELGADALIEGTVTRTKDQLRITANLIRVWPEGHIWAESYESAPSDILLLQEKVARSIARAVQTELSPEEQARMARARTVKPEAYDAVVRGRYLWNKRDEDSLHQAMEQFRQAADLDPTYAAAYVGQADCYNALGYSNYLAPSDAFPRGKAAATRALELDPEMAEAHASLGYALMYYDWDFLQAETEFRRAIELNPNVPLSHQWYGYLLTALGRFEAARAEIDTSQKLDPLSVPIATDKAFIYHYSGSNQEALHFVNIALEMNPKFPLGHFWRGRIYTSEGRYDEALAEFTAPAALRRWQPTMAAMGFLYGVWGKPTEAQAMLKELDTIRAKNRYVTSYAVALVYAGLGNRRETFHYLEKSYEERSHWLVWLERDPRWNLMRTDPRFTELVHRVGLP